MTKTLFKSILTALALSTVGYSAPVGPPGGPPVYNQTQPQANSAFNVGTGTVRGPFTAGSATVGGVDVNSAFGSVGTSTSSLQTQIIAVGVSTAALRSTLSTVATDTTTLRTAINATGVSTGSIRTDVTTIQANITSIGLATGTIRTDLNAVGLSTGAIATTLATKVAFSSWTFTDPILHNGSGGVSLNKISLSTGVTGILPVANGGSGTATPSLLQGANVTISGTWPNQTIASTGGGSGGSSALAVFNGVNQISSPTPSIAADGTTLTAYLVGTSSAGFKANASSVTLQGQNVIKLTETLQSGATLYVSSGSVAGQFSATSAVFQSSVTLPYVADNNFPTFPVTSGYPVLVSSGGYVRGSSLRNLRQQAFGVNSFDISGPVTNFYNGLFSINGDDTLGASALGLNGIIVNMNGTGGATSVMAGLNMDVYSQGAAYGEWTKARGSVTSYGNYLMAQGTGINYGLYLVADSGTANHALHIESGDLESGGSVGTSGQVLTSGGTGTPPTWTTPGGAGSLLSSSNTWSAAQTFISSIGVTGAVGVTVTYGVTAGSFTTTGAGGGAWTATEGTSPGGQSGKDVLYPNSTSHRWTMNNNNGTEETVVGSTDTVTPGHIPLWSGTGKLIDGGLPGAGGGGSGDAVLAGTQTWSGGNKLTGSTTFYGNIELQNKSSFTLTNVTLIVSTLNAVSQIRFADGTNQTTAGGGGGGSHNILSGTHTDSVAGAVARGSILYGNTTPAWDKLSVGGSGTFLRSNGTDPSWQTVAAADLPVTVAYLSSTQTFTANQVIVSSGGLNVTYGVIVGSLTANDLTASLPVKTNGAKKLVSGAIDLSGSEATGTIAAARMPALTGDVTTTAGAVNTTLTNSVVTLAKMENRATQTFIGRNTAGTGVPEEISASTAKTMLNLTGTNSGDQTITLSGDASGSGTAGVTVTNSAAQPNITTLSASSVTVTGNLVTVGSMTVRGSGLSVAYGVSASSVSVSSLTASGQMVTTGITVNELTASQFVVSDANKKLSSSLNGSTLTNLTGANIVSVIPSAMLVSTVSYTDKKETISGHKTFSSSQTYTGSQYVSSTTLLSGNPGTNGQVYTSGGPGAIPSWTTVAAGNYGSIQINRGGSLYGLAEVGIYVSSLTLSTGTYKVYASTFEINGGSLSVNSGNVALNNVSTLTLTSANLRISNTFVSTGTPLTLRSDNIIISSSGINSWAFTSTGTWTKPAWAKMVRIRACGSGGGGGGGNGQAAGVARGGASGGGGGACVQEIEEANRLPSIIGFTIPGAVQGGAGGTGGNGLNGAAGLPTTVYSISGATWVFAGGGGAGFGSANAANSGGGGGGKCGNGGAGSGTTVSGGCPATAVNLNGPGGAGAGSGTGAVGKPGEFGGGSGGSGAATTAGFAGGISVHASGGGGGSGGCTTGNVCSGGGAGGMSGLASGFSTSAGGGAAGTSGATCTTGTAGTDGHENLGGFGGGAGGSDQDSAGCVGGAGGLCGGGGGGGGAGTNAGAAGGAGGAGCIFIWAW